MSGGANQPKAIFWHERSDENTGVGPFNPSATGQPVRAFCIYNIGPDDITVDLSQGDQFTIAPNGLRCYEAPNVGGLDYFPEFTSLQVTGSSASSVHQIQWEEIA